jgi:hypothetical protein
MNFTHVNILKYAGNEDSNRTPKLPQHFHIALRAMATAHRGVNRWVFSSKKQNNRMFI